MVLVNRQDLLQGRAFMVQTVLNSILYMLQEHGFIFEDSSCLTGLSAV